MVSHACVGRRPRLVGHRGDDGHLLRADDLVRLHPVGEPLRRGGHDDGVPVLQVGDEVERLAVGDPVPGDREVADLPGQRGVGVVADALLQLRGAGALYDGDGVVGAEARDVHDREGVPGGRGLVHGGGRARGGARGARRGARPGGGGGRGRVPPLLQRGDRGGLRAPGGQVGPVQLPDDEEQRQHPGGEQQLAHHGGDPADHPGPAVAQVVLVVPSKAGSRRPSVPETS